MRKELKPVRCGCGGEAVAIGDADYNIYFVKCDKCWISTDLFHSEAEAIETWNRAMSGKDINVLSKNYMRKHEVALLLAEMFGDTHACNFNDIDEWLPKKCAFREICPDTVGVACWEQFLKYRGEEVKDE